MTKKLNKKVIKNFSWALLGRIIAALCQTAGIILLARWETVSNFGITVSLLAFTVVLNAFIDFGLTTYMIKERAKDIKTTIVNYCLKINSKITIFIGILFTMILFLLGFLYDNYYLNLIPIAFWIVYERRNDQLLGIYIADGDNKTATQLLTYRRIIALILFIIMYNIFDINPTLSYSLAILIPSLLMYYYTLNKLDINVKMELDYEFKELFKETLPFWINSLFAQLRNIDVTLVALLTNPIHAAYFGFINRAVTPLNMISTSMASVILPSVSKKEITDTQYFIYIVFTTVLSSIPFIFLYFTVDFLIPFALGDKYIETIPLFKILTIGLVFFSASSIMASILQAINLQKKVASANILTTTLYLVALLPATFYGSSLFATYCLVIFFVTRFLSMGYYLINKERFLNEK